MLQTCQQGIPLALEISSLNWCKTSWFGTQWRVTQLFGFRHGAGRVRRKTLVGQNSYKRSSQERQNPARGWVLHRPRGAQSPSEKVWQRLAKPARGSEFRAISLGTMVLPVRWVKRCKKNGAQCSPNSSCSSFFNRRSNLLNAIIAHPLAPILEEEAHSFARSALDPENRFATAT